MCHSHHRAVARDVAWGSIRATPGGLGRPYGAADRRVRASDNDRQIVIDMLNRHTGAGRLTLAEFDQRAAAAYAATTLAELDELLRDLPAPRPAAGGAATRTWGAWLLTAAICLLVWGMTSIGAGQALSFWPFWVIVPWGAVLVGGSAITAVAGRRFLPR